MAVVLARPGIMTHYKGLFNVYPLMFFTFIEARY